MAAAAVRSRTQRLPPEVTRRAARQRSCSLCLIVVLFISVPGKPRTQARFAKRNSAAPRRILYVRNLPFNISADEMYDIFGKFGAVRQIRL